MTRRVALRTAAAVRLLRDLAGQLETTGTMPLAHPVRPRLEELVVEATEVLRALQAQALVCETCGAQLVRKRYASGLESPTQYVKRRYCDQACAGVGRAKLAAERQAKRLAKQVRSKECEWCGETYYRRTVSGSGYESPGEFAKRRACSRECGLQLTRVAITGRPRRRRKPREAATPTALHLPDPRPRGNGLSVGAPSPIEGPVVAGFDASVCEEHGVVRGFYGCTACNASAGWRAQQRSLPLRPMDASR